MGPFLVDPDEPPAQNEPLTQEGFPIGFAPEEEAPQLAASESAIMTAASTDGGTIELEPNVIQGTARLTNQAPEILALLAADPWHTSGSSTSSTIAQVTATSTKPSGYSGQTSTVQFKSPSEFDFTLLVESSAGGADGVFYNVSARRGAYTLPTAAGVVVRPRETQPNPTQVEIKACIGAVQFDFGTDETCGTPSPAFLSASVQGVSTFRLSGQQSYATYLTGGTTLNRTLYYNVRGKDGRTYAFSRPVQATPACDQVVHICTPITDDLRPPPQGNLTGPWEVIGETSTYRRAISATYLALPTITRSHSSTNPTSPLSDPSTWWTMNSAMDVGDWSLQGSGYLRTGREFTRYTTTLSPSTPAGPVTVIANQVTPVTKVVDGVTRHAFSMRPAYFYGAVRLADPSIPLYSGSRSTLESLWFEADYDSNGDGIPNDPAIGNNGTYLRASVTGDYSHTAFPHTFDRIRGELASNYEQALPSAYDLPRTWNQEYLSLRFWSQGASFNTRPGMYDEALFRNGSLTLVPSIHSALLNAGDRKLIDHEYCFNEVQLQYATTLGRFYNPWADVSGKFDGRDWRNLQSTYSVGGRFYGIPAIWGYTPLATEPQSEGSVSMVLPQGEYTLKPGAYMKSDDGTTNTATFAPLSVRLGCGQRVKIVPPLAVSISSASGCATGPTIPISGVVKSKPALVDRIWYRLNGGPEVPVCNNCGLDPSYAFTLELNACHNTLEVFAFTHGMPEAAIGKADFVWDDPSDGPSCSGYCVNRPPVARCRGITIPADSACSGCASVDDGSYDPDDKDTISCVQTPGCQYALGSQKVTLTCTDKLGLSSSCEATVTVEDLTPPALVCPAETPVLECRDGGAVATYSTSATDNCGGVSTRCAPASGASFPLGTTQAACTATDRAGNTASCAIPVTVQDSEPPTVSCPAPITAECVGGGARVTPPAATAADTCALTDVTQPAESSFPLGSTPITYSAKDAAGQQVHCTSSVNVVDTQAPTLVLNGPSVITLDVGNPYTEQGATASDSCEGELSSRVRISGTVDTSTPGSYTVTYTVADGAGHEATTTRTVHIVGGTGICPANSGRWESTSNQAKVYQLHTATLLPSGKVLVVGGNNRDAELYDPANDIWTATGMPRTTHRRHTATLLRDDRVLVVGGDGASAIKSAEVYNPATGAWAATGNLVTYRREHSAVRLADGRVLVMGGKDSGGTVLSSAEVYDPATGTWASTGGMAWARRAFTATVLSDGRVLVTGGLVDSGDECRGLNCLASAEVYNPATGTWSSTGGMATARGFHAAAVLADGKVLVTGGGVDGAPSAHAEVYNPAMGQWTATGDMHSPRRNHSLTPLNGGLVLAVGGYDVFTGILTSAELYDPNTGAWCTTGSLGQGRYKHTATPLPDGRVLITAGLSNGSAYTSEVYSLGGR
ncbi:kelch repeat-containing protein [Cystobacter fuscus]|uniref:kelch repeat-containing protein n=1 Tax=Cystobacter fuscus TaxID=43 RepID=UPI0037C0F0EF